MIGTVFNAGIFHTTCSGLILELKYTTMFYGSMRLRDKRVDKILGKAGYSNAEIFYSPIKSTLVWISMLLLIGMPLVIGLFIKIFSGAFLGGAFLYILISYLLNAFLNNSFALSDDALIVINPNFPFRQLTVIPIDQVEKIEIDKAGWMWLFLAFAVTGNNYLSVHTSRGGNVYFCVALEMDAYDENWTEKTIDDLHQCLKGKGIPVQFNLD